MGGGWLGVELACALRQANRAATVVLACQEAAPLGRFLPKFLRAELKARLSKSGVVVRGYSQLAFVYEPASARVRSSETANDDSDLRAVETRIAALHAKETAAEAHAFCRGDEVELHGLVNNDLYVLLGECCHDCDDDLTFLFVGDCVCPWYVIVCVATGSTVDVDGL